MTDIDLSAAVEAALWAWIESATVSVTRENVSQRVLDLNRHRAEAAIRAALPHILAQVETTDERIGAWEAVASHEALKPCRDEESPLLDAVLDRLTALHEIEQAVAELAPVPVKPSRERLTIIRNCVRV